MSLSMPSLLLIVLLWPPALVIGCWYAWRGVLVRRRTFVAAGLVLMYVLMLAALYQSLTNVGLTGAPVPPPPSFGVSTEDQFLLHILKETVLGILGLLILRRWCIRRPA